MGATLTWVRPQGSNMDGITKMSAAAKMLCVSVSSHLNISRTWGWSSNCWASSSNSFCKSKHYPLHKSAITLTHVPDTMKKNTFNFATGNTMRFILKQNISTKCEVCHTLISGIWLVPCKINWPPRLRVWKIAERSRKTPFWGTNLDTQHTCREAEWMLVQK